MMRFPAVDYLSLMLYLRASWFLQWLTVLPLPECCLSNVMQQTSFAG